MSSGTGQTPESDDAEISDHVRQQNQLIILNDWWNGWLSYTVLQSQVYKKGGTADDSWQIKCPISHMGKRGKSLA